MFRLTPNPSNSAVAPAQLLLLFGVLLLSCSLALAEDREHSLPLVAVSTTGTAVLIDEEGSGTGQLNFEIELAVPAWIGRFSVLLEAGAGPPEPLSCGPQTSGDFHNFAASAGDARVMEFTYRVSHHTGDWVVGFQEARGTIDTSRVANNDKTHFLASAFVNNPTISLPGSTVGLSWQRAIGTGRRGIGVTATRYERSGAFLAAESWWAFDRAIARIGAWKGRAEIACGEHSHQPSRGHGLYASIDGQSTSLQWNLRAGWGRHGEVPVSFIGLAIEIPLASGTLGLALGQGRVAEHEGTARESYAEMYLRYSLPGGLMFLPGLQLSDRLTDGSGPDLAVGFRFGIGV